MPDRIIPFPQQIIGEAGGLVDETGVELAVYGEDLDPTEITVLLGSEPTSSHRRGEHTDRSPPSLQGAWLLNVRGVAPVSPEELTLSLLQRLPEDEKVWLELAARYDVRLRFAVQLDAWNRGFALSPALVQRIARLHATISFDICAEVESIA